MQKFNVLISFVIIILITIISIIIGAVFFNEKTFLNGALDVKDVFVKSQQDNNKINNGSTIIIQDNEEVKKVKDDKCCNKEEKQDVKTKKNNNRNLISNNNKDIVVVLIENNMIDKNGNKQTIYAKQNKKIVGKKVSKKKTSEVRVVKKKNNPVPVKNKKEQKNTKLVPVKNKNVPHNYTPKHFQHNKGEKPKTNPVPVKNSNQHILKKALTPQQRIKMGDKKTQNPTKRDENEEFVNYPMERKRLKPKVITPKKQKEPSHQGVLINNVIRPEKVEKKEIIQIERVKEAEREDGPQEIHNIIKIDLDDSDDSGTITEIDDTEIIEEEQIINKASKR